MSELELTVEKTIKAPIEKVYKAWLNPELLAQFMRPAADVSIPEVAVDAKVGGKFKIIMMSGENSLPHSGEYKELTPFTKMVFTWESPFSMEGSTVTLNLKAHDGGTHISLHQIKFPSEESRNNHNGGWTKILSTLDSFLTN